MTEACLKDKDHADVGSFFGGMAVCAIAAMFPFACVADTADKKSKAADAVTSSLLRDLKEADRDMLTIRVVALSSDSHECPLRAAVLAISDHAGPRQREEEPK